MDKHGPMYTVKFLMVGLVLSLGGCQDYTDYTLPDQEMIDFQHNLNGIRGSRYEDAVRNLGIPSRSMQLPDGRTVAEWSSNSDRSALVSVPGPMALGVVVPIQHGERLTLWFSADGRVIDGTKERW